MCPACFISADSGGSMVGSVTGERSAEAGTTGQDNILVVAGDLDGARSYTELRMSNGQVLRLPTETLLSAADSSADFQTNGLRSATSASDGASLVVPIVEEQITVGKRTVATGTLRLLKSVQEYEQALNEQLAVRTFDVERVVLNRQVDTAPEMRQEGETTIYPVVEERLILTKELILKEEVRVTKRDSVRQDNQVVTLRKEQVTVERHAAEPLVQK